MHLWWDICHEFPGFTATHETHRKAEILLNIHNKYSQFCLLFCFLLIWGRVALCNPGWPGTHSLSFSELPRGGVGGVGWDHRCMLKYKIPFCLSSFCHVRDGTQGLVHTKQIFLPLIHIPVLYLQIPTHLNRLKLNAHPLVNHLEPFNWRNI